FFFLFLLYFPTRRSSDLIFNFLKVSKISLISSIYFGNSSEILAFFCSAIFKDISVLLRTRLLFFIISIKNSQSLILSDKFPDSLKLIFILLLFWNSRVKLLPNLILLSLRVISR